MTILPIIFGLEGETLTAPEAAFFKDANPLGFILFARNCSTPEQVARLTAELKTTLGRDAPILIDQEGGKVARLTPPHWRDHPSADQFADLITRKSLEDAAHAAYLNAYATAVDLAEIGITMNCAPVADMRFPDTHPFLSSRCYADNPDHVITMAEAVMKGHTDAGISPVIKHLPGHGRATADSHLDLPTVAAGLELLDKSDFKVFRGLKSAPFAMTAHIVYEAVDAETPATLSKRMIDFIRTEIGFGGIILSDAIEMKALEGSLKENAVRALAAGCDVTLHCTGKLNEMQEIVQALPALPTATYNQWLASEQSILNSKQTLDRRTVLDQLSALLTTEDDMAIAAKS